MATTPVESFLQAFDPFIPLIAAFIGAYVVYVVQRQNPVSGGLILGEIYSLFTGTPQSKRYLLTFLGLTSERVILVSLLLVVIEVSVIYEIPTYGSLSVLFTFIIYTSIDNHYRRKRIGNSEESYLPYILKQKSTIPRIHKYFLYSSSGMKVYGTVNLSGFMLISGITTFYPTPFLLSFPVEIVTTFMLVIGLLSNFSRAYSDFDWVSHNKVTSKILNERMVLTTVYFNDKHNSSVSHISGRVVSIWPKFIITYGKGKIVWREQIRRSQVIRVAFNMQHNQVPLTTSLIGPIIRDEMYTNADWAESS